MFGEMADHMFGQCVCVHRVTGRQRHAREIAGGFDLLNLRVERFPCGVGGGVTIARGVPLFARFVEPRLPASHQRLLPAIGRGCESADMIDNTLGLVVGLGLGVLTTVLVRRRGGSGLGSGPA